MIPDRGTVIDIVKVMEETTHAKGWGFDPMLFAVGEGDADRMIVIPLPVQPADLPGKNMQDKLGRLAQVLNEKPELAHSPRAATLAALILINEGWSVDPGRLKQFPGKSAMDIPGSVEIRVVTMVDCAGRAFTVVRERGREPLFAEFGTDLEMVGMVPVLLASVLKGFTAHLPPTEVDRPALNRLVRLMKETYDLNVPQ